MMKARITWIAAALFAVPLSAQSLRPGYADPRPVLAAAEKAIGAGKLKCVTISGSGYTGSVGQQREAAWNVDWPRGEVNNYRRTMNWDAGTMHEQFERKPGQNPASWKYGLGWRGGTPLQRHPRQTFVVNGKFAWHIDGGGAAPVAAPPGDAELWQLDLWLNPHGFLKAAKLPGANPKAVWRWELGESGRDGATTVPEKVTVVSIEMLGKYRVDATINKENLLQRIHTWVPDPVFGDTNYEHEFSNDTYIDAGNGIRFPTVWHHHEGWDDNFGALNVSAGHNAFGGKFDRIEANACAAPADVPAPVRQADHAMRVEVQKLADGVYLMGGGSHNSVAIEFKEYIAVVEAPLDEERSLAVIEEVVKLIPSKPIRFVVNTHQHSDHAGGLRTYMHIGATIVTQWKNFNFYNRDVLNYAPRTMNPDMLSLWPPTEVSEGYQYETVRENYTFTDGARRLHLTYVQPLDHAEGMLMAYLPNEKLAIEADLFDSHEAQSGPATASNRALHTHMKRLRMEGATIVPIHGRPVTWDRFLRVIESGR
jgi:glyoxylase-like metal-dependent hydrolase (beta-lactamase superfamily II)